MATERKKITFYADEDIADFMEKNTLEGSMSSLINRMLRMAIADPKTAAYIKAVEELNAMENKKK